MVSSPRQAYFNFINSLNSEYTKKEYGYCLDNFLNHSKLDLNKFLKLPEDKMTNIIINYLVQKKVSRSLKNVIFSAIKHACKMNDVHLNWDKIKKFVKSQKTGNEQSQKNRAYSHQEIQQILNFSDQRVKTAILILCSTGVRIGALPSLKVGDLQRIDDIYRVNVYAGEKENYYTFCTPECAKEIDSYLEFRKRRGEKITSDSYLLVKKFSKYLDMTEFKGQPFSPDSLRSLLQDYIENSGLREINRDNPYKRKDIPLLHGLRRFFETQIDNSKVDWSKIVMLMGWKSNWQVMSYHRPNEGDVLNEYYKAIPALTISNEERLKFKLEEKLQVEKSQIDALKSDFEKFKNEVLKQRRSRK